MAKPSGLLSSRNQKSRGFKAKLALKSCLILVITIWMIYQLKVLLTHSHSLTNKGAAGDQGGALVYDKEELMAAAGGLKLGRKGLILIDGGGGERVKSDERNQISSEAGIEDGKSSNETSSGEEDEEGEDEEEERSIEDLVDGIDKDGDEEEQLDDQTEEDNILHNGEKTAN